MSDASVRFHRELNRLFSSPEDLVARALELLSREVPAERLSAFRFDSKNRALISPLCISRGAVQELEEQVHLVDGSPLAQMMDGKREALSYASPRSVLYVPLRSSESASALGALRLERSAGRPFTASQRTAAAVLAVELAVQLAQAELSEQSRRRLRRLEALTELTAIFASSLRVEDGLKLILQGIQRHLTLDRVRLYLVDRGAKKLRGELSVGMRGRVRSLKGEEISMVPGEHRFVDLLLGTSADPILDRYQQTVLHVPLIVQGAGIGLLVLDNLLSQEAIEAEDVELLKSFAGQIALAVDNARLFEEVQELSLYDSLTGLPVRRYFMQRFQEELYRAQRANQELALAMLDLDYFKGINDTYGHQIGDQVLEKLGKAILAGLRRIDVPCRYGGDEILLLLPQCGEEEAVKTLTRLAVDLRKIRVPVPFSKAGEVSVTTSIGIAVYPSDGKTIEALIQRADEALYAVKSKGRDNVACYSSVRAEEAKKAEETKQGSAA